MSKHSHTSKGPWMHITRRDSISRGKAWAIRLVAVLLALVVCGLFIVAITKQNPLEVYSAIIDGAVGTNRRLMVTIREAMTLLLVGVALVPAFKMRFWNIGAEGQILIGGTAAAAIMIYFGDALPGFLVIALMIVVSLVAGMIWGGIPAFFKARYNTNETLFTLMLNYVAMQVVTFCIVFWENPSGSNTVGIINASSQKGWLPSLFGLNYGWTIVLVIVATVITFVYLMRTRHGYELSVVGESQQTAKYAGINVKRVIIQNMLISGAICGFAGFLIVSGSSHTVSTSLADGRGFTAIIVAWMSKFNPWAMVLVSALLVFMQQGSIQIASQYGLNEDVSDIITGILLFFLIGCEFFIQYRVALRERAKEA